ncbi:hypothetical protein BN2364_4277 [Alloalcanivorax xenomutans]|nr:hypothetical protein BN2364_4277 [Alloalcanivorax xenomutans]
MLLPSGRVENKARAARCARPRGRKAAAFYPKHRHDSCHQPFPA